MSFRIGYGKRIGGFYIGASKSFGGKKGKGDGGCLSTIIAITFLPLTLLFLFFRWVYRKTKEQKAVNPDTVWYKRTWGIILMLILFFPIGIYLLWRYSKWNTTVKGVVTGIAALFVIAAMAGNDNKEPEPDRSMPSQLVTEETTEASSETGSEATTGTTTESETTTTATSSEVTTESVATTQANTTTSAKITTVTKAETTTTTTTTTTVIVVTEAPTEKPTQRIYTYVLNTSTKKFHYHGCNSVGDIKAENYGEYTGTRDEVMAQGYQPCGRCKP
ncbi:MAG: hypothetical protein PUB97_04665 [Ruminococcus sp.]|nr:hypothetical protein [Ruminococcus sp.]